MKYQISPSLMCMNLMDIRQQLAVLNRRADMPHIDIMDGHYVKNITRRRSLSNRSARTPRCCWTCI